jgi:hypothetical protein
MEIGKPLRVHRVEPLKSPVPRKEPAGPPQPGRERPQADPARAG